MPFLGVYDLFGTALIVPLHIYTGDGALFLNISYHSFFPDYLERGMADSNSIPFLYLYTNRRELLECIGKKASCRYENVFVHLSNYWTFLFMCF